MMRPGDGKLKRLFFGPFIIVAAIVMVVMEVDKWCDRDARGVPGQVYR